MKTSKKICILLGVALFFCAFNTSIYFVFTKRCMMEPGRVLGIKTIELERYLPFDDKSEIVKEKAFLPLDGELPVLDGAEGLFPVYSAFANAIYPEGSVMYENGDFTAESRVQMANTLKAYSGVVDGTCDIAFVTSASAAQLEYAKEKNVELEFVPIGREAFVFLVNKNNPVDDLSTEQVRGIYSGKIKNWSEVGGNNILISALTRIQGSGSQSMLTAFMKGEKIAKDYNSFAGSAIGFSFRYYVSDVVQNGGVKMLKLNGVYPDKESIKSGDYPVVADFYALYDKNNDNPNIPIIIEWILSEQGQSIIEQTGYVPVE